MKISEMITDKYKLRIPPTVYYELLADVQEVEEEQEPTTKNEAKYCDRSICLKNEYNNVGCEDCEVTKSQEPTTKNDLGVDCISREQALVAIRNLYPSMPRVDFNGSLRKWVDKYKPYIECDDAIKQLPSVTPQEPKTGHWNDIPKYENIAWLCSECGHFTTMKHNFCPNCGARMVEPQESEDKE